MDGQNDSIVLEEEIDPNYEPTEREVLEYATWLGMDLENEQDLFWIAREGLKVRRRVRGLSERVVHQRVTYGCVVDLLLFTGAAA